MGGQQQKCRMRRSGFRRAVDEIEHIKNVVAPYSFDLASCGSASTSKKPEPSMKILGRGVGIAERGLVYNEGCRIEPSARIG